MTAHAAFTTHPDPAFVALADTVSDVHDRGIGYTAYFQIGGYDADVVTLLGVIREADEMPMDRTFAVWALGLATVLRWETECEEWGEPDHEAQRGYDAAKEARL